MPMVTINGVEVEVDKGASILEASAQAGFDVPHFCYHPALSSPANCRMCLVEVERAPKLLPACYNEVAEGMVVQTESEQVVRARKAVLEFILVNHPVDCPICDKAGECKLQDYYFAYDAQESRMRAEKQHKVKAYPIGPRVVYDGERCILCTRCIRFCEEITGTSELTLIDRGDKSEVRTFPGMELNNDYSLCTVDVCPVGALTSRDFRFKCRVWLLTSTESLCNGCSGGCNIHMDHFRNEIQRYRPRYNPEINDYWMCDRGRLDYKHIHTDRLLRPLSNGAEDTWHALSKTVASKLKRALDDHGAGSVALVLSAQASCEDLLLAKLFKEQLIGEETQLFMGGAPDGRSDDLLMRADKNPNRRGVEAVFGTLDGIKPAHKLAEAITTGSVKVVYMMGSELGSAHSFIEDKGLASTRAEEREAAVAALSSCDLFILQSSHGADLLDAAHIVLPACTHAEKDGTFVNEEGIAQPFYKAFEPHGDSLPDWQIFMRLSRAMGSPISFTFLHQIQARMFEATEQIQKAAEDAIKAAEEAAVKAAEEAKARAEAEAAAKAAPPEADAAPETNESEAPAPADDPS